MKAVARWLLLAMVALTLSVAAYAEDADPVKACYEKAKAQPELNKCAELESDTAYVELNETYQAVLKKHADDKDVVVRLREAQRAWIDFRDAEMDALYPHHREDGFYGPAFPACWFKKLTELTRERTEKLHQWLAGVPVGEACAGVLSTPSGS